jgi:hypothetical protein
MVTGIPPSKLNPHAAGILGAEIRAARDYDAIEAREKMCEMSGAA